MLRNVSVLSKVISVVIALMFFVIGMIFFIKYDPQSYDREATGVITAIDEHYELVGDEDELMHDVYIDYTIDGTDYKHVEFFEYNSSMKVGDTVTFYYMSDDPTQIAGSDKDLAPYFGLGAAVIGLIMLIVMIVRSVREKKTQCDET